jgi:hypothetical protein
VAEQMPLLAGYAAASIQELIATGPRAGHPVRGLRTAAAVGDGEKLRCARREGFSLHANVALDARAREQLEHLCRYLLRLPLALDRHREPQWAAHLPASPSAPRWRHASAAGSPGAHRETLRGNCPSSVSPAPLPWRPGPALPTPLRSRPSLPPRSWAGWWTAAAGSVGAGDPPPSILGCGRTLMGGRDEAGVRDRRAAVPALRGAAPPCRWVHRGAEAARSP